MLIFCMGVAFGVFAGAILARFFGTQIVIDELSTSMSEMCHKKLTPDELDQVVRIFQKLRASHQQ